MSDGISDKFPTIVPAVNQPVPVPDGLMLGDIDLFMEWRGAFYAHTSAATVRAIIEGYAAQEQRIAELTAQVERLTAPVSMEELPVGKRIGQMQFNRIIAARAALAETQPTLDQAKP